MKCLYLVFLKKKNVCHLSQILLSIFWVKLNYGYQQDDDLQFACWVKISADNILKYLFLILTRKHDMILYANCLLNNLHEVSDPIF